METIQLDQTVGNLVSERPARARIFEALGIDYCCGGKIPLKEACNHLGLNPDTVLKALAEVDTSPEAGPDCNAMSLTELVDHIVDTHHAYLNNELPRLTGLIEKVVAAHGEKDARLAALAGVFHDLQAELEMHMNKEEQVLFPAVRELEGASTLPVFHCGSLSNPIGVMEMEHDNAGKALAEIRRLSDDYATPEWACNTYRALMDGLSTIEKDLHLHIHKENNILFPRVIEAERRLSATTAH